MNYLISLPFGKIQSRHAIAMMLSYFGSNEEVYDIMSIMIPIYFEVYLDKKKTLRSY